MTFDNNILKEHLELIQRYLDGSATDADELKVHQLSAQDPQFKKELDRSRKLSVAIQSQALGNRLEDWHQSIEVPLHKHSRKPLPVKWMVAMASVAAISLLFLFLSGGSKNSDSIFEDNFVPDPGLPTVMGATDNYIFNEAMLNYKRENYKEAIDQWELLQSNNENNDTLNYFIGVAYLAVKEDGRALEYLKRAKQNPNTVFENELYHFMGMAYLKSGNIDLARESFAKSSLPESKTMLDKLSDL